MNKLTRREFLRATGMGLAGATLLEVAGCGQRGGGQGATPLTVGVLPFLDYTGWVATSELGIDKEQSIELTIQSFPLEPNEVQAFERGAVDIASGALGSLIPLIPKAKTLRLVGAQVLLLVSSTCALIETISSTAEILCRGDWRRLAPPKGSAALVAQEVHLHGEVLG